MKYKIILGGRGAECYSHPLTDEQTEKFKSPDFSFSNDVDYEKTLEILGVDNHDESEKSFVGAFYDEGLLYINVSDEEDKTVWEYDGELDLEIEDYIEVYEDTNHFIFIDDVKGNFHIYDLEIDGEFDPNKLSFIVKDIEDYVQIITSLKYDGQELEFEWGDYWGKGLTHCFNIDFNKKNINEDVPDKWDDIFKKYPETINGSYISLKEWLEENYNPPTIKK
jgi:hypothetical protein